MPAARRITKNRSSRTITATTPWRRIVGSALVISLREISFLGSWVDMTPSCAGRAFLSSGDKSGNKGAAGGS
jgi:hypothetical protein